MNSVHNTSTLDFDDLLKVDPTALNNALSQVKYHIITKSNNPFLSTLLLNLKHRFSLDIPTAATNGVEVIYNPLFFMNLDFKERLGLVCHEVWHVAYSHMLRRGNRDPKVFNMAGDYVINLMLTNNGYILPPNGLIDAKYKNMSTEEVYTLLIDEGHKGEDTDEDIIYATGTKEEIQAAETKVKEMIVKATEMARMSKNFSSIPAEIAKAVDDLINPQLDWRGLLVRFINDHSRNDYSWKKPNKRFMPTYYLPSNYSEAIDNITIALDTSGSISQKQLKDFLSECVSILNSFTINNISVISCDCSIKSIDTVENVEDVKTLQMKGGGGTSFHPVFEHCEENPPTILIYFTDLYAKQIQEDPGYPVIWICHSKHPPAPIGETYYYESNC